LERPGRDGAGEMDSSVPVGAPSMVKRNREIAEVREQLLKADQQLDVVQARNHSLLEESSELDSELARNYYARGAVCEQQLAELFELSEHRVSEIAAQQARRDAATSGLRAEAAEQRARLATAETGAENERCRAEGLEAEMRRLRARLEAEEGGLAELRKRREEQGRAAADQSGAILNASRQFDDELQAMQARQAAQSDEFSAAKLRFQTVEAQLAEERRRREDLNHALRKAVSEQVGDPGQLMALEAAVEAQGGSPAAVLARVRAAAEEASSGIEAPAAAAARRR